MKLKRAEDLAERDAAIEFFASTEFTHMALEEQVLLPAWLEKASTDASEAMARRVVEEHQLLISSVERIRGGEVTVADLRELGIVLERHVRYEERELFPVIEADLSDDDLSALGEALKNGVRGSADQPDAGSG